MQYTSDSMSVFAEEIFGLISLRQEGGFWDFKKEWHLNKTDLLHDVICMANNQENRDAYIIIGVDEENDCEILDTSTDPNRRSTQNLVDFLKDKDFAGGIRPSVLMKTLAFLDKRFDIIIILNSKHTPFYLIKQFEGVRAHHIYSRIMNTNTPIDKTADINIVEYLWKKRFHLLDAPLERVKFFLANPAEWDNTPAGGPEMKYYRTAPEYTIQVEGDSSRDGYEFYMFSQVDSRPHWFLITIRYHQTMMEQVLGIGLDGARCFVVAPERGVITFADSPKYKSDLCYSYYVKNSLRYYTHRFFLQDFTSDSDYAYRNYIKLILVFSSALEKESFEQYVSERAEQQKRLSQSQELRFFPDLPGYNMDMFKKEYADALALNIMLAEFRTR